MAAPSATRAARPSTYRVHYAFDYYRFSEQAMREVIFEGMERVRVRPMMSPPRLIGYGASRALARASRGVRCARRGGCWRGSARRNRASSSAP